MKRPGRKVRCQVCPWNAIRQYGARGILVGPCPQCGHRITYAAAFKGDQPVTPDVQFAGLVQEKIAA
jgi:hypothetical protein